MASFTERVLILCKTYPSPSAKYAETSCVAGMTEAGKLIRLYPVPFRLVSDDQQFKKWQWITARFEKARDDHRPESHRVFVDTIACDSDPLPAGKHGWPHRAELLAKLPLYSDFSQIEKRRADGGATLALLKPARIIGLDIKMAESPTWTDEEKDKLLRLQQQGELFDEVEVKPPRIPEPVRSRGWGIVSHGTQPAGCGPTTHGAAGGCSGAASPRSFA